MTGRGSLPRPGERWVEVVAHHRGHEVVVVRLSAGGRVILRRRRRVGSAPNRQRDRLTTVPLAVFLRQYRRC